MEYEPETPTGKPVMVFLLVCTVNEVDSQSIPLRFKANIPDWTGKLHCWGHI